MCTLVILRRPGHVWPVIIAANRDEMIDRPWRAPDRHWPDRPEAVGGLDELAGGSWLAVNQHGVAPGILNRIGTPGSLAGPRTRGQPLLEAVGASPCAGPEAPPRRVGTPPPPHF